MLIEFFGLALSALLPLINPLGSALVFLGPVHTAPPKVYRELARRIAITTIHWGPVYVDGAESLLRTASSP